VLETFLLVASIATQAVSAFLAARWIGLDWMNRRLRRGSDRAARQPESSHDKET
jgi:hypothetical protein